MTIAGSVDVTQGSWRALLPAGRRYVALPARTSPIIVAERDDAVLSYVQRALLASPPGARLPPGIYEALRRILRVQGAWRLAPLLATTPAGERAQDESGLAEWLARCGHRLIVLQHSHDADRRLVLLLFEPGSGEPSLALKVAQCPPAALRIEEERERLRLLTRAPVDAVRATMPRLVELPDSIRMPVLATTAQPGTPMFVANYRNGHSRRPEAVRADFAAAQAWLTALQSQATGAPVQLDVAPPVLDAPEAQIRDRSTAPTAVRVGLAALRRRLRLHRVARTLVHGDFWSGNILLCGGAISGVVDWERAEVAGSPIRDLGRFATAYSLYLDRQTRPSRRVAGHPGLVAGGPGGGVGYAMSGSGWYSQIVRTFLSDGLRRLGLPQSLWPDLLVAELAAMATEATDPQFRRAQWQLFGQACEVLR